ncbi:metabotropic glutamate receptor-like protein [Leptotrombidium deliense]|uniref:Metabotropic glutamate receptor-like protein n=1 Tax=Leptotrombidium deliense TaxID=299467 RepID=A0A443S3D1_9ACAR|nr:metabotropic glutamate receptor-like protein [Leptotrombidium deliense]
MFNTIDSKIKTMDSILEQLGLTLIQIVDYWPKEQFEDKFNVCIANTHTFDMNKIGNEEECNEAVEVLLKNPQAKAVLLMVIATDVHCIMSAAQKKKKDHFQWITLDTEAGKFLKSYSNVTERLISIIENNSHNITEFNENYFDNLSPENHTKNPYFAEAWQRIYYCDLGNATKYGNKCSKELYFSQFSRAINVRPDASQFIISFMIYGMALHSAWQANCKTGEKICDKLRKMDGNTFFNEHILNVNFPYADSNISLFEKELSITLNVKDFQKVGDQRELNDVAKWQRNKLITFGKELDLINSTCTTSCAKGYRQRRKSNYCGCVCDKCNADEYLVNKYTCKICEEGTVPNSDFSGCIKSSCQCSIEIQKLTNKMNDLQKHNGEMKCRMMHFEYNMMPQKYKKPNCTLD